MFHTKKILNRLMTFSLLVSVGFVALLLLAQTNAALAATAPSLGTAATLRGLGRLDGDEYRFERPQRRSGGLAGSRDHWLSSRDHERNDARR